MEDEENRDPPTTHFIAAVEDLTNMLDYTSEDIYGMDTDARDEQSQNPPHTLCWAATSTYDVYMVDTPKGSDDEEHRDAMRDRSLEKQSKRRRKCRSKPRLDRDNSHIDPAIEQDEPADDEHAFKQLFE